MISLGADQMAIGIDRRRLIAGLGNATAAWPLAAHAQQVEGMRRIGVLMAFDENDPEPKAWLIFRASLSKCTSIRRSCISYNGLHAPCVPVSSSS